MGGVLIAIIMTVSMVVSAQPKARPKALPRWQTMRPAADPPAVLPSLGVGQGAGGFAPSVPQYSLSNQQLQYSQPCFTYGPNGIPTGIQNPQMPWYLTKFNSGIPQCGRPATASNMWKYDQYGRPLPPAGPNSPNANPLAGPPGANTPGSPPPGTNWNTPDEGRNNNADSSGAGNYNPGPLLTGAGLLAGLCGPENESHDQVKRGYCKTLLEALMKPGSCLNNYLNNIANADPSKGDNGNPRDISKYCTNFDQVKRNPVTHAKFWQNLLGALAQEESGWNNAVRGDGGKSKGIFQIGENDADPSRYGDCAECSSLNVNEPHSNTRCGAYVAMRNMMRDYHMADGAVANRDAIGIARYFGPFGVNQMNKKDRIQQKARNWCKNHGTNATPGAGAEDIYHEGGTPAAR